MRAGLVTLKWSEISKGEIWPLKWSDSLTRHKWSDILRSINDQIYWNKLSLLTWVYWWEECRQNGRPGWEAGTSVFSSPVLNYKKYWKIIN